MPDPVACIESLLRRPETSHVHLMGVGGVGMAGLAALFVRRGFHVTGCDLEANRLTARLVETGVAVALGHDAAHLDTGPVMLVRSTAVPDSHPEVQAARARGIPVYRRGEVLPALLRSCPTVAISGTHGKTTTTAMCAHVVRAAGRDASFLVGGEWEEPGRVFGVGSDPLTIVEADESDGTLVHYKPDIALITGIDYDHMEHFRDETAFNEVFRTFMRHARDRVICCWDDERLRARASDAQNVSSYGFAASARVRAAELDEQATGTQFTLLVDGRARGRFLVPVPGAHNVQNALGALAVVEALGLDVERAAGALAGFRSVRRRFERVGSWRGVQVYSDYAHHPTEIQALIGAARRLSYGRLLAIFQPHRYTRTRALGSAFPPAFSGVDHVILAPIYAASEQPVAGGTEQDLEQHFENAHAVSFSCANGLDDAWTRFSDIAQDGDVLLLVGAGDIERLGQHAGGG